ncbi:hypothetical protein B0T24DRAFT_647140 [Lasiosphaeria ovina]|uniref:T6SS Phospholipase effector Tle1-like catalytic domain-containing protein n=1 Tax=Lasiosphaeria ovina TaxID=92902 RepID=A0AAE0NDP6_9PEZI|nr:hypothetical protein B0T24DRAFT_647140 [Lasiosphaeria ovina]
MSSISPNVKKRLIVCSDGTWMNSDTGYSKPTFWNPVGKLQTPSNVTRISRSLRRTCADGAIQIIEYHSGVGTGGTLSDVLSGGAFGLGISENIRGAYSFICANYCDGDEIILVGFSRGAFTVRSVAGMVGQLGLLTREGMEFFYPIYKDMQNWHTPNYEDPFPSIPFDDKPRGEDAARKMTRVYEGTGSGPLIKVKAVAVWDTERTVANRGTTELRQVWFPGNHGNVGGGWQDAGVANMSLAWMMDQLASIGVEFDEATIARIFTRLEHHYRSKAEEERGEEIKLANQPPPPITSEDAVASSEEPDSNDTAGCCGLFAKLAPEKKRWAAEPIYRSNAPVRPWGLGGIFGAEGFVNKVVGYNVRSPGMYKKVDPETGEETRAFLEDTNERMHGSVRVRLALKGLGLNDRHVWKAPALDGNWRLRKTTEAYRDPIPSTVTTWELPWVWEYCGSEKDAPQQRIMVEEPLGPFERQLLRLSGGTPNVYEFAESIDLEDW